MKHTYRPTNQQQKSKRDLEKVASRGVISRALSGEQFGQHPGYAELRIKFFTYVAQLQTEVKLTGHQLDLLVSSAAEVEELGDVLERAIHLWINGRWDRTVRRFSQEEED